MVKDNNGDEKNDNLDTFEVVSYEMMKLISDHYGFEVSHVPTNIYFAFNANNNTFGGSVGQVNSTFNKFLISSVPARKGNVYWPLFKRSLIDST